MLIKPEDQMELTEAELQDDQTCILRATDPNAPENVTCFNYEIQQFKIQPAVSQMGVHFEKTNA